MGVRVKVGVSVVVGDSMRVGEDVNVGVRVDVGGWVGEDVVVGSHVLVWDGVGVAPGKRAVVSCSLNKMGSIPVRRQINTPTIQTHFGSPRLPGSALGDAGDQTCFLISSSRFLASCG